MFFLKVSLTISFALVAQFNSFSKNLHFNSEKVNEKVGKKLPLTLT